MPSTKSHTPQIISRQRVADHGEVFTAEREVKAMCDLVKNETERIESRFLEPACGQGAFLIEILRRKLAVVSSRYAATQSEWERHAAIAVSSLYGIDILADNVTLCRNHLYDTFLTAYRALFPKSMKPSCCRAVRYLLAINILWGDALTLQTPGRIGAADCLCRVVGHWRRAVQTPRFHASQPAAKPADGGSQPLLRPRRCRLYSDPRSRISACSLPQTRSR